MSKKLNNICYLNDDKTPYIAFYPLDEIEGVKAGFSTRLGGVSKDHLSSLNLGFDLGDDRANVLENYRRMGQSLGFDINDLVLSVQVHKADVIKVDDADRGHGITSPIKYESADGLITDIEKLVLTVRGADCTPMFFVDKETKVIATAHGGWAGTVNKIAKKAIDLMVNDYGCKLENIVAVIGPSICPDCYEISQDVADRFRDAFAEKAFDEIDVEGYINKCILTPGRPDHYQANLWLANREVMLEAGLSPENIHNSCLCTKCNMELFYSHRGMGGKRGVMSGFLFRK